MAHSTPKPMLCEGPGFSMRSDRVIKSIVHNKSVTVNPPHGSPSGGGPAARSQAANVDDALRKLQAMLDEAARQVPSPPGEGGSPNPPPNHRSNPSQFHSRVFSGLEGFSSHW